MAESASSLCPMPPILCLWCMTSDLLCKPEINNVLWYKLTGLRRGPITIPKWHHQFQDGKIHQPVSNSVLYGPCTSTQLLKFGWTISEMTPNLCRQTAALLYSLTNKLQVLHVSHTQSQQGPVKCDSLASFSRLGSYTPPHHKQAAIGFTHRSMMEDDLLPKRSPDQYQRLVMINGICIIAERSKNLYFVPYIATSYLKIVLICWEHVISESEDI